MNEKYEIRHFIDNQYAVYDKNGNDILYKGDIVEINAWISMKEKGFNIY